VDYLQKEAIELQRIGYLDQQVLYQLLHLKMAFHLNQLMFLAVLKHLCFILPLNSTMKIIACVPKAKAYHSPASYLNEVSSLYR